MYQQRKLGDYHRFSHVTVKQTAVVNYQNKVT